MKRTLRLGTLVASMMAMATTMQNDPASREVLGLPKLPRKTSRLWTCRKCGDKFHPNISNSLCDNCIRARDGGSR